MLEGLKRWFSSSAKPAAAPAQSPGVPAGLAAWAERHQYTVRGVREAGGFVVEGRVGALPWRLEWGASQRNYIVGTELRIRAELGLPGELQSVVLTRPLAEAMEKAVFDQYVEGVQTRIDSETPPEMRWLVIFPKLSGSDLGALRERWVALCSVKTFCAPWLEGPLAAALQALPSDAARPVVLMIGRGRLALRTALPEPDGRDLDGWLRLFEVAVREARRAAQATFDSASPSTQPSLWTASALPDDAQRPK